MPIKIVHCADLHIGSSSSTLGVDGLRRSAEILSSLGEVVALCNKTRADILLIAGDLFDSPCPDERDVAAVKRYLNSVGSEVFIVPGNHDYLTPSSPYMEDWGYNIHIFTRPGSIEMGDFRIWGVPFVEAYSDGLPMPVGERDGKIEILLMHGDIFGGPYNPLTEQKIAATGMDYVALGHVHAPSGIKYAGKVPYAYPGSVEPLGFDETGEHGAVAGTISKGAAELEQVRLCRRIYHEITVDTAPFSDEGELLARLAELTASHRNDMVKFILSGECAFSPNCEHLKTSLEDSVFHLRIKDRTYPKENLALLRGEQTLKGIFTDKCLKYIDSLEGEQKATAQKALQLGLAAFAGREVDFRED